MKIDLFKSTPTGKELEAIKSVLLSRWWAKGKIVDEFEKEFAEFVGAKYAVATNSCTSALEIAVKSIDLPETCTVSPFTFVSSALCLLNSNKEVEFLDIDEKSLCTRKADIQVLYGGNDFGEGIIYDMAHAGGMKHKGLVSCWSFHAVKNIPAGDGGMLTTNDYDVYQKARALSWCGIDKSTFDRSKKGYTWNYNIEHVGLKANMNDITASIAREHLRIVEDRNRYRYIVSLWYDKYLDPSIKRPFPSTTWHLYTLRVKNRDKLIDTLSKKGVSTGVHYKPLYKYPIFGKVSFDYKNSVTEKVFEQIISLPMHVELTEENVKYICGIVNQHVNE